MQEASFRFTSLPTQEQAIYRTIYYSMFAHWRGHNFDFPERFFLSCRSQDVGPDLLLTLQKEGHPVSPGSSYRHGKGIHCSVERIEWISENEVKVSGGYSFGPLGGEWGYFTLKKSSSGWEVVSWLPTLMA